MPRPSKRKKISKLANVAAAVDRKADLQEARRKKASVEKWETIYDNFSEQKDSLANPKGKQRTFEENKMLLLALRGALDAHLNRMKLGVQESLTWTTIEKEVATTFQVGPAYVKNLRREFLATGQVRVWERRGVAEPDHEEEEIIAPPPVAIGNNHNPRSKLLPHHLLALCRWVDRQHGEGRTVTNSKAQNFIPICVSEIQ